MSASDLIIFGAGDIAQLACHYFRTDSALKPKAFTVDGAYLKEDSFEGLPVVPFEELHSHFSPDEHQCFVALSYSGINAIRRAKFEACRSLGYRMASYISSRATVLTQGVDSQPITAGLSSLNGQWIAQWHLVSAGSILAALPPVLMFFLMQRHFIAGLTLGAVK